MLSVNTVMQHLNKPPLLAQAFANLLVSWKNEVKFVLNVQDLEI